LAVFYVSLTKVIHWLVYDLEKIIFTAQTWNI